MRKPRPTSPPGKGFAREAGRTVRCAPPDHSSHSPGKGLARALSKLGFCSRSEAWTFIKAGRVRVNGVVRRDAEWPVDLARDAIEVDGRAVSQSQKVYVMLNKPRGLVTTAADEQGRATVFSCLQEYAGRHLSAVGRLDKASEGLLLLTNDTHLAARLTEPGHDVLKTYHVQLNRVVDEALAEQLRQGVEAGGDRLACAATRVLRTGTRTCWLEIQLDEGKNRHIRRLLEAFGIEVLRLVRVAIGPLALGDLAKGKARELTPGEVKMLNGNADQR